ncbi:hypothetical protein [Rhodococcoides fascians]|uniref:hypothetical protein n=1 Tax=Rhodococcoides fascians TaxID=1828 RepID=UPI00056A1FB0|nr:hypothetical protein [Rhodococcus fascians]
MISWTQISADADDRLMAEAGYPDECNRGWLPQFAARAQVLHPAFRTEVIDGRPLTYPVRWRTVAETLGTDLDDHSTFGSLICSNTPDAVVDGLFDVPPEVGQPPLPLRAFFDSFADVSCRGLIWTSLLRAHSPLQQRPEMGSEILTRAGLSYLAVTAYMASTEPEIVPNLWWPADKRFCVATGIDEQHTTLLAKDPQVLNDLLHLADEFGVEYRRSERYC